MFSDFKRRMRAIFADKQDIVDWYSNFAPAYDRISWQTEIILKAESARRGIVRGIEGYPCCFVNDIMKRQTDTIFGDMLPRFAGSGRKKAVYVFGKQAAVKLALQKNALVGDFMAYDFSRKHGLTCLPTVISRFKESMLCEYALLDQDWFASKLGIQRKRICELLGLCVSKETPANDLEEKFISKVAARLNPVYASFNDMQILAANALSFDILDNDDNWGLVLRHKQKIPVLIDCGR